LADLVFFYGTLMAGFDRRRRAGIDSKLSYVGRGAIKAALFDLGLYPAAVPAPDRQVWGEVYEMSDTDAVLAGLDDIGWVLGRYAPDAVLVTIPEAERGRLDGVVEACRRADVSCRFVRRQIDLDPAVALGAVAE
jgi:gamma-glutamylcyclotransferase (GGCT)/AIG2-like uncharacterized protein YtfP